LTLNGIIGEVSFILIPKSLLNLLILFQISMLINYFHYVRWSFNYHIPVVNIDLSVFDLHFAGDALHVILLKTPHKKQFETLQVGFVPTPLHHNLLLPVDDALVAEGTWFYVCLFDLAIGRGGREGGRIRRVLSLLIPLEEIHKILILKGTLRGA